MMLNSKEDRDIAMLLLLVKISENMNELTKLIDQSSAKSMLNAVSAWEHALNSILETIEKQEMC